MTADQFIDAMDLVEEQRVDPMGCDNGSRGVVRANRLEPGRGVP
jgi:hypothetical protein